MSCKWCTQGLLAFTVGTFDVYPNSTHTTLQPFHIIHTHTKSISSLQQNPQICASPLPCLTFPDSFSISVAFVHISCQTPFSLWNKSKSAFGVWHCELAFLMGVVGVPMMCPDSLPASAHTLHLCTGQTSIVQHHSTYLGSTALYYVCMCSTIICIHTVYNNVCVICAPLFVQSVLR